MEFGRLGKFVCFLSPWEFVFVSLFFGIYGHIAWTNRANKSSFQCFSFASLWLLGNRRTAYSGGQQVEEMSSQGFEVSKAIYKKYSLKLSEQFVLFSVALALVPLRNLQTYRPDLLYKEWQSQCFVCLLLLPGVVEEFVLGGAAGGTDDRRG